MENKRDGSANLIRLKINGSIIFPESYSKEILNKFDAFIKDNGLEFIGEIGELIPIIKLNKFETNKDLTTIWDNVIEVIKKELTEVSFNTWIRPIKPHSINEDKVELIVANYFIKGILDGRYSSLLKTAIKYVTNKEYEIQICVEDEVQI